jgi:hypothetical protein
MYELSLKARINKQLGLRLSHVPISRWFYQGLDLFEFIFSPRLLDYSL